jgi:hypothetical protein
MTKNFPVAVHKIPGGFREIGRFAGGAPKSLETPTNSGRVVRYVVFTFYTNSLTDYLSLIVFKQVKKLAS